MKCGPFSLSVGASCLALGCAPAHPEARDLTRMSQRLVLSPSAIAVLSGGHTEDGVPSTVTFGEPDGASALFLDFPSEWQSHGPPMAGYLALAAGEGAVQDGQSVTLHVWRVRAQWLASELHDWSDKPSLAPPFVSIDAVPEVTKELRIDVTDLLRFMVQNPRLNHGFALFARSASGHGLSFATGTSGGWAPRLEIYVPR